MPFNQCTFLSAVKKFIRIYVLSHCIRKDHLICKLVKSTQYYKYAEIQTEIVQVLSDN